MFYFSQTSSKRLSTCDPRLQKLFNEVIKTIDCTIACGFRNRDEQEKMYNKGLSQKKWPDSKHNQRPSLAVDVYPYINNKMINGDYPKEVGQIKYFAGQVIQIARYLEIPIIWGGDWNNDGNTINNGFNNLGHYELI